MIEAIKLKLVTLAIPRLCKSVKWLNRSNTSNVYTNKKGVV